MKPNISVALLVSLATPSGYLAAFVYELGYTNYFGVPAELISIGLTNVLLSTSAAIVVALTLFAAIESVQFNELTLNKAIARRLIAFLTLVIFMGTLIQFSPDRTLQLAVLAILAIY